MRMGSNVYCINCGELLKACQNTFLSMQTIHDRIRRRNLPFTPNLYKVLGMNIEDGMQNFADLVLEGKNEFEEYNSLIIQYLMDGIENNSYTFKDNFFDWIDDKCPPSDVEFKPHDIIQMTNTLNTMPSVRSASQWRYDRVTGELYCLWSNCRLHYFADYPYRAVIAESSTTENPSWTESSGVYLVDDPDYFIDQVSYNILQRINEYQQMIQLAGFSSQLQLDRTIQRLEKRIEENRSKSEDLYWKYKNM